MVACTPKYMVDRIFECEENCNAVRNFVESVKGPRKKQNGGSSIGDKGPPISSMVPSDAGR